MMSRFVHYIKNSIMSTNLKYQETKLQPLKITSLSLLILVLLFAVAAASEKPIPTLQRPHILVLDNCDSDYKNPPFNDEILILDSEGELIKKIGGLNVCQNIGGNRAISVSEDGSFFVVCENVADKITTYDLGTGEILWSLPGKYNSAIVRNNIIYAHTTDVMKNNKEKERIKAIDRQGNLVGQSGEIKAFDLVVDPNANCLWLVEDDIKKCDMNFKVLQTIDPITWYAVSVDINPDGSIWAAERQHIDVRDSQNRLLI